MSNSPLVQCVKISPNRSSPRQGTIHLITIHCMAGDLSAAGCGEWMAMPSTQASSNYGIGTDGSIGMYVEESDRAWTSSNQTNDNNAITIEVSNDTREPNWHCSDKAMASLVLLCADICRRNGIPELRFDPSDASHPTTPNGNMTLHKWFKNKACPGPYLESNMAKIASEVNKLIQSGSTSYTWDSATASGNMTGNMTGNAAVNTNPTLNVDISNLSPFVVTASPNVIKINYDMLKQMQVSGMMFEAGYLYNSSHSVVPYRNKNLMKQVKDCNKAGLRFALYTIVRSRTIDEAREECKQLYFTVSKYPPGMGIWLKLEFSKSQTKSRNHDILDLYLEKLQEWGLDEGCGLYCTRDQLDLINWSKYKDKFLLWYINMFTSDNQFDQVQQIITPEFFQVNPHLPTVFNTSTAI